MKKIKLDKLWIGIIHMGLGTILAQMINIISQPILTRIFSIETLGIYTYLISLANVIIPISSLKLDMLIVSEADDREAQYITDVCIIINILVFIIYTFIIFIGCNFPKENIFNKYGLVIYIVPIIIFTNGLRFLFISYLNRYQKYKTISLIGVIRESIRVIFQIIGGVFSLGVLVLSLGYALSPLFGLNIQIKDYLKKLKKRPKLTKEKFKKIIFEKGRKQIFFLVPGQFINSFSSSLVMVYIAILFSEKELGYYSAGVRVLEIPIIFITSNVSKVCYQNISENIYNKKPILRILMSVTVVLSVISIIGFSILYFIAPKFSEIIFGEGYKIAGEYIKCMCIMYAVRLVATSFSGICILFKKQEFEFILNILLIIVAIFSYLICNAFNYSIIIYLKYINVGYAVVYLLLLVGCIILCKNYDDKIKELEK